MVLDVTGQRRGDRVTGGKIIFVNRFFYPDESATAQILTDLAVELAERGHAVSVIASANSIKGGSAGQGDIRSWRGVAIHRVRTSRFGNRTLAGRVLDYATFYPGAFFALLRHASRGDVVVAKTDPPLISVVAALAARLKGARLVNWLQDLYPEVGARLGVRLLEGPIGRLLVRLRNGALRRAVLNVAIGQRMRERLIDCGVDADQVAVIPNWTDDAQIRPMPSSESRARRLWGLPPEAFVVGYSGNLGRAHESDTIFGATRALKDRPEFVFLFVGGGREQERLRERVKEEGLANVVFRDHQPKSELAHSLAAADVHWLSLRPELEGLIVPSKFYGIAAAGRPVIAITDPDGEIARVVRQARCGDVVTPGDVAGLVQLIERMAEDRPLRAKMGQRAREAIDAEFSRGRAMERWMQALDRVVAEPVGSQLRQAS